MGRTVERPGGIDDFTIAVYESAASIRPRSLVVPAILFSDIEGFQVPSVAHCAAQKFHPISKPDRSKRQTLRLTFIYASLPDRSGRRR
jgi:hypothetical protein